MNNRKYNIGIVFIFAVLVGLQVFSKKRNQQRNVVNKGVEFLGDQSLFVSQGLVNKLLIQNDKLSSLTLKETIDLKLVEQKLEAQEHVEKAEVYLSVNGRLSAKVKQRVPTGRLYSSQPKYIDEKGMLMPLSSIFSARVPLVFNFLEKSKKELVILLNKIKSDAFLQELVVGVDCLPDKDFTLQLRGYDFKVQLGSIDQLDLKCNNFKVFFAKANKDQLFKNYKHVNLGITNQVVCTKKE